MRPRRFVSRQLGSLLLVRRQYLGYALRFRPRPTYRVRAFGRGCCLRILNVLRTVSGKTHEPLAILVHRLRCASLRRTICRLPFG